MASRVIRPSQPIRPAGATGVAKPHVSPRTQRSETIERGICLAVALGLAMLAILVGAGCNTKIATNTKPLDEAGIGYNTIQELQKLEIAQEEVLEVVKAKNGGVSDATCVEFVKIAREHHGWFESGDAVASLRRVGAGESTLLELARLNQYGLWVGEAQAVRLTGFSDNMLLILARRRAASQPYLSGASLARLKNAGLNEETLLVLAERGVTDADVPTLLDARKRGVSESQIRAFTPSVPPAVQKSSL